MNVSNYKLQKKEKEEKAKYHIEKTINESIMSKTAICQFDLSCEKRAASWLKWLPLELYPFDFTKDEFCDRFALSWGRGPLQKSSSRAFKKNISVTQTLQSQKT